LSLSQISIYFFQSIFVVLALFVTQNILFALFAFLITQTVGHIVYYVLVSAGASLSSKDSVDNSKDTIHFGKSLSIAQVFSTLAAEVDKLLIWHFFGSTILAVYAVALVGQRTIRMLTAFITDLALPRFSQRDMQEKENLYAFYKKVVLYIAALVGIYAIYILFVPFFFNLFFPEYESAIFPAIILGALIVIAPVRTLYDQLFIAAKKVKNIYMYRVIEIITYLIVFFTSMALFSDPYIIIAVALPASVFASLIGQVALFQSKV
jgi:O-antigen/teichoic acid export membrane protein